MPIISGYAKILLFISLADLLSTLALLKNGFAEINPILSFYVQKGGLLLFAGVKSAFTLLGFFIFETLRIKKWVSCKKIRFYYLLTICLFLGIYLVGVMSS